MTIEEIIYMARQAGMGYDENANVYTANINDLIDFATNIIKSIKPTMQIEFEKMFIEGASFEREACAKVAEKYIGADPIAGAIRERAKP